MPQQGKQCPGASRAVDGQRLLLGHGVGGACGSKITSVETGAAIVLK